MFSFKMQTNNQIWDSDLIVKRSLEKPHHSRPMVIRWKSFYDDVGNKMRSLPASSSQNLLTINDRFNMMSTGAMTAKEMEIITGKKISLPTLDGWMQRPVTNYGEMRDMRTFSSCSKRTAKIGIGSLK